MSQADWLDKDFYAALGVGEKATPEEIRKAYRQLARENHPDANPDDAKAEERFKAISEAHDVLKDAERRAQYDQIRHLSRSGGMGGGFGRGGSGPGGFRTTTGPGGQPVDLNDLLGSMFGEGGGGFSSGGPRARSGGGRGPQRGNDLSAEVTLSFDDAMAGVTVTLRLRGSAACSSCRGSGAQPPSTPDRCPTCNGRGQVQADQGMFSFAQPCPQCGGRGEIVTDPCRTCDGSGIEDRPRTVKARLPAGVKDGQTVRLPGKGEPGRAGARPGDLLVKVHVEEHAVLRRNGDNLSITVPVTFPEATLGAHVAVPTVDGSVTVKIPAGTESNTTLRVRGKGAPKGGGKGFGDLLVTIQVVVPRKLTKTQQKLVEEFADLDDSNPRAHFDLQSGDGER